MLFCKVIAGNASHLAQFLKPNNVAPTFLINGFNDPLTKYMMFYYITLFLFRRRLRPHLPIQFGSVSSALLGQFIGNLSFSDIIFLSDFPQESRNQLLNSVLRFPL